MMAISPHGTRPFWLAWQAAVVRGWRGVRQWWAVLQPAWFAIVVSLAVSCAIQVPQAIDVLSSIAIDPGRPFRHIVLISALFVFALSCWYFARAILYVRYAITPPDSEVNYEGWRRHVPRLVGLLPIVSAAIGFARVAALPVTSRLPNVALYGSVGGVFLLFVWWRRRIYLKRLPEYKDAGEVGVFLHPSLPKRTYRSLLYLLLLQAILFAAVVGVSRVALPQAIGPLGLVLIAAAAWVGFVSTVLIYPTYRYDLPSLFVLTLVGAVLFSFLNDNHLIRTTAAIDPPAPRRLASESLRRWLDARQRAWIERDGSKPYPVFIVAAEGGGIRAAYWTAAVLASLQQRYPAFGCHVFAISGTSGGSLGGAVYASEIADLVDRSDWRCTGADEPERADVTSAYRGVLGADFLSPTLAGMLFPDLVQRYLPFGFLPDRAAYMESAWETAWSRHAASNHFAEPFQELWRGPERESHVPALFFNVTRVDDGGRAAVANVALDPARFGRLDDLVAGLDQAIPLSTAVHLSARFTYVSPAGTVATRDGRSYRVVDGGYFDNSGALTAAELVRLVADVCSGIEGCDTRVMAVALIVSNNVRNPNAPLAADPTRCAAGPDGCQCAEDRGFEAAGSMAAPGDAPGLLSRGMPELLSPILALFNTRSARGFDGEARLREVATPCRTVRFQMRPDPRIRIPLGWMLSRSAQDAIDEQARSDRNAEVVGVMLSAGAPGETRPPEGATRPRPAPVLR